MSLDPDQMIGQSVGAYTVDELIGEGAFAWVFRAHHTATAAPAALKILRPRYAGDPQFETRFRNEAKMASEFEHPAIVRIREVGQDHGTTYFAMDHYAVSLAQRLEEHGPLGEREVIAIARSVAAGLAHAHAAGIIHRDIKVDNILLGENGRAVITDFGIARAVSGYASATGQNMTIGTPHYVSPEQAQGRTLDGRSDLYALGVTLYKAVTGKVPFTSTDWFELARMHVEDPPPPPRTERPDLSARLERVILRLLAKHPDDRYASAEALLTDLQEIERPDRHTNTFGFTGEKATTIHAAHPRTRLAWLLAILLAVAVAGLIVLFGQR